MKKAICVLPACIAVIVWMWWPRTLPSQPPLVRPAVDLPEGVLRYTSADFSISLPHGPFEVQDKWRARFLEWDQWVERAKQEVNAKAIVVADNGLAKELLGYLFLGNGDLVWSHQPIKVAWPDPYKTKSLAWENGQLVVSATAADWSDTKGMGTFLLAFAGLAAALVLFADIADWRNERRRIRRRLSAS